MIDDPVLNALSGSSGLTADYLKGALERRRAQLDQLRRQVIAIQRALRDAEIREERDPPLRPRERG